MIALSLPLYFASVHAQYLEDEYTPSSLAALSLCIDETVSQSGNDETWGAGMIATQAVTEVIFIGLSEACAGAAAAIAFRFNIADGSGMTTAEQNASVIMLVAAGVLGQYAGVMLGGEMWDGNGSGGYTLLGSAVGLAIGGGLTTVFSAIDAPDWLSLGLGITTALASPIVFYHASAADRAAKNGNIVISSSMPVQELESISIAGVAPPITIASFRITLE